MTISILGNPNFSLLYFFSFVIQAKPLEYIFFPVTEKPPTNEMLFRSWQALKIGMDLQFVDKEFEILKLGDLQYTNLGQDEPRFD